jgi:hypothetical protein
MNFEIKKYPKRILKSEMWTQKIWPNNVIFYLFKKDEIRFFL